ncbi:MAG: DUF3822 family protein [Tenacibaculum sp.]|nr:DUF3822 family protein [Tenacibaculum sp.]
MKKKIKQNTSLKSQEKKLSIQFSLDGFSFCITDIHTKSILVFTEYEFDVIVTTPELLLEKIKQIFHENKELQQDFKEVIVIHQNYLSTIVPDEYFDEEKLKTYLDYTIKTLPNDYIVFDGINTIKANNVYIPFVNVNNYLFQNFGEFEFKHHSTVLIEKLMEYTKNDEKEHFFVNVSKKNIDIVVTKNNELILYNSFLYNTKEDFIYYILFVAEQLEINFKELQLTFLGSIKKNNELYNMAYKYVKHISFIQSNSDFFANSKDFTNYSNYILIP